MNIILITITTTAMMAPAITGSGSELEDEESSVMGELTLSTGITVNFK